MVSTEFGFIFAAVSILGFGSNFVVVKKYESGDGMFFQLCMCIGIWIIGLIVQLIRGSTAVFEPYAMLGGFFWATGNICTTPIIKCIGMALGLLIWGGANMLTGWCMGYFGLFGVKKADPANIPELNIAGVCVSLAGMAIYFLIEPAGSENKRGMKRVSSAIFNPNSQGLMADSTNSPAIGIKKEQQINQIQEPLQRYIAEEENKESKSWVDYLPSRQKQMLGIGLSLFSGFLYGINLAPPTHLEEENRTSMSSNGLDYVFSHFCGILLTSVAYFIIYTIFKKNDPQVNPQIIVPGMISGMIWGISQASWFIADDALGVIVAYPLITTGPGIIASLWGLFMFQEISGTKNIATLLVAIFVSLIAVTLITLSKVL